MTIPPDVLARAREAFAQQWSIPDSSAYAALDAALSVLSAAWPAADGRLREALRVPDVWPEEERDGMAAAFKAADGKHGHYETLFAVAAWLLRHRASRAALSPPSAPAAPVRVVRVAVAEQDDGSWAAMGWHDAADDGQLFSRLRGHGYPIRLGIGVMVFPVRDVPTVRASVTEADRG